jgi:hypothetical protein
MDVIRMVVRMQSGRFPTQSGNNLSAAERTKDRCKPDVLKGMPGAWLNRNRNREGPI